MVRHTDPRERRSGDQDELGSAQQAITRIQIPTSLQHKLREFRRRVWGIKLFESVAAAVIGILVGFLATYLLDRLIDTPAWVRMGLFALALSACLSIPFGVHRWVIRRRRWDQLARLLSQTQPAAGDQLLGVIELSEDAAEQRRSPVLVQAAIEQVADHVVSQDLSQAIPSPKHRQRAVAMISLMTVTAILWLATTSAASNAWARFLTPWKATPRYTFASVQPIDDPLIVPHGENATLEIELQPDTKWAPADAQVRLPGDMVLESVRQEGQYRFELPGQFTDTPAEIRVGDFRDRITVHPVLRPELKSISVDVRMPEYVGRPEPIRRQVRGGTVSVLRGSTVVVQCMASRPLATAMVDGKPVTPDGQRIVCQPVLIDETTHIEVRWQDQYGLSGLKPYTLSIEPIDDLAPTVVCEDLPRRKVLLDTDVLAFKVRAYDDYGVKRVGIQWHRIDDSGDLVEPAERLIGTGDPRADQLELAATFCAKDEQIRSQRISLRVFVEDYLPGRPRAFSVESVFDVLDASQHAIWVSSQLNRWHRMSLDVRDQEMQLHETNKQLREMTTDALSNPETRQQIERQADRERANARRLSGLVRTGEGLLREAMRNPEIAVAHLDRWAEMMQTLKTIADDRMPTVADLLQQAAKSANGDQSQSPSKKDPNRRQVGQNRAQIQGDPPKSNSEGQDQPKPAVPSISDVESTHHQFKADELQKPSDQPSPTPRLSLPGTQLAGNAKSDSQSKPEMQTKLDMAIEHQEALLAEFDAVADELSQIMANLEGSTLVKRLKAASRRQQQVAARLATLIPNDFGVSDREKESDAPVFSELSQTESDASQDASNIMDDMDAYYQRSRLVLFGRVLEEMRQQDVTAALRQLSDDLRDENGLSIAQAEYWSDTLDRWAEDLVEVTKNGEAPGMKAKGSLPPAIILDVLKLLDGEVKLREQTRVAEQVRSAVSVTEYVQTAERLSSTQNEYRNSMEKVVQQILELPNAEADFDQELNLLTKVGDVMQEATEILAKPETGAPAIAAETEVIELLLQSKRFNPNAGGGGGSNPGGGGNGDTETPALALVGVGVNEQEVREEMSATTALGTTGPGLPEEFRAGLDQYFSRLEGWRTTTETESNVP